jgi:alcohol dehydrogenase YqhD (iron-dependent ADH family)
MENFIFQNITKIIFGKAAESKVGSETKAHGQKILLHYGGGSIKKSGLYDRIVAALSEAGVEFIELGGVVPNPRLGLVREGIELCRKEKVDFVLAVGGGSVIDSAKAIAAGVLYEGDVWDFFEKAKIPETALPIGVVLTIPAAGSESSPNAVITDEERKRKLPMRRAPVIPVFAIMNPELTFTLPAYQTACGLSDMLAHVLERYFTDVKRSGFVDELAEATMRSILKYGRLLIEEPDNYEYRAEIMWAGTIAHNGLLSTGSNFGDWATHGIEHELSARYDIAHGAGLAILFPAWMKYVYENDVGRFAKLARSVFRVQETDDRQAAWQGIEALQEFYRAIKMPTTLEEAGLDDQYLEEMATLAVAAGPLGSFVRLQQSDVLEILRLA